MRADQQLEGPPLGRLREAVEGDGTLAHVRVDRERDGRADRTEAGGAASADEHPVADAADVDDEVGGAVAGDALGELAPQGADQRVPPATRSLAERDEAMWQSASASASAASGGRGGRSSSSSVATIRWTCSFVAEP